MFNKKKSDEVSKILKRISELEAKGKLKDAIKEIQKAIKLSPEDGGLYNRLGDLYIKIDEVKDSIETYEKGVEAFRKDSFFRNALALCKKVLRYDPGNIEIHLVIAELLLELDEKSDALIYFWGYVEKQLAQENTDEVLKTLENIKKLGVSDAKVIKRINETYKAVGREDLAKKFVEQAIKEEVILEEIKIPETAPVKRKAKETKIVEIEDTRLEKETVEFGRDEKRLRDDITHLDDAVKDVEVAISQLRKALRLDEVIIALDKSLTAMSDNHKKAIALLQKSLSLNLDTLQKSVRELRESSGKNTKDLEVLLNDLSKSLSSLSKNQVSFAQRITETLKNVSSSFNTTAKDAFKDIKSVLSVYEKATNDMCHKLDETKECSTSLLKINEEMKGTVQQMNDSLIKYIIAQEIKEKKQGKYALVIIIIMVVICGLFIFSILK